MFQQTYNGIINVNRGDSFELSIPLNYGTNLNPDYRPLTPNSYLYLGIMEPNQPFENALIKKRCTIEDMVNNRSVLIKFKPQDTQCVLPGKYYYQVKVQTFLSDKVDDYLVDTIVDKTLFYILE